jgi:hypothetical protein
MEHTIQHKIISCFLAGTSGKFDRRIVRHSTLFFAIAVFLYALVRLLTLPVA